MSGGSKQKFKQFTINSVEDACVALGTLISCTLINLEKYKEYSLEANSLFMRSKEKLVLAKDYDDINDKLLYRQHELLKYIADRQTSSFSYVELREKLLKKTYLSKPLTEEMKKVLDNLLDIRNWTFHNPQSRLVAAKEAYEKRITEDLKSYVKLVPYLNPVIIQKTTSYDLLLLASLIIHTEKRTNDFEKAIVNMKSDYQEMYNSISSKPSLSTPNGWSSDVQYIERPIVSMINDYDTDVAQISMAIQKAKYDGSDEAYQKLKIF